MEQLVLYGYTVSNFSNKVKLALLLKGIDFKEKRVSPGENEKNINYSPAGLIPFIQHNEFSLSDSQAICEYLEAAFPGSPTLIPQDIKNAARMRQVISIIETIIDSAARRIYTKKLYSSAPPAEAFEEANKRLQRGVRALNRLDCFSSSAIIGAQLTLADCAAMATLPLVDDALNNYTTAGLLNDLSGYKNYYKRRMQEEPFIEVENARKRTFRGLSRRTGK
jgi:glutathione S-transferase